VELGEVAANNVDNNGYYVWGGFISDGSSNKYMYYYNVASDSWSVAQQVEWWLEGDHQVSESYNGKLYGFGGNGPGTANMKVYDPNSNVWTELAQLNVNGIKWDTTSASSGIIGDKFYVAGGIVNDDTSDKAFVYDISNNVWNQIASMPDNGRNHAAGIGYNGKFYVFGGRQNGNYPQTGMTESFVYDPSSDTWSSLESMPSGTGGHGQAVEVNGKLVIMGGEDCCESHDLVYAYDVDSDSWQTLNDMKYARHGIAPVKVGNAVYVAGGGPVSGFAYSDTHQAMLF
jgi:N-acetylneuraminic acid mutarotase